MVDDQKELKGDGVQAVDGHQLRWEARHRLQALHRVVRREEALREDVLVVVLAVEEKDGKLEEHLKLHRAVARGEGRGNGGGVVVVKQKMGEGNVNERLQVKDGVHGQLGEDGGGSRVRTSTSTSSSSLPQFSAPFFARLSALANTTKLLTTAATFHATAVHATTKPTSATFAQLCAYVVKFGEEGGKAGAAGVGAHREAGHALLEDDVAAVDDLPHQPALLAVLRVQAVLGGAVAEAGKRGKKS